jgi:putative PIN family toxin of toxin-antitoxin system
MKVVLDTNVVVSANLNDKGASAAIVDLATNGLILMFVSEDVLSEYGEVLRRPRFGLLSGHVTKSLAVIRKTSRLVRPTRAIHESDDEPDNRILECARGEGRLSDHG